jgi:hypothetical protein
MNTIFCDFCQFSVKNLAFFSKINAMITFSAKLPFVCLKNGDFCGKFFCHFFLNCNIGPWFHCKCKEAHLELVDSDRQGGPAELLAKHGHHSGERRRGLLETLSSNFKFQLIFVCPPGSDFSFDYSAENKIPRNFPRISWEKDSKLQFKNFDFCQQFWGKKFCGILRGKNVRINPDGQKYPCY